MSEDKAVGAVGKQRVRPFVLGYAERRPLDDRPGRYDEAGEVWVIQEGAAEVPLVRSRVNMLEESITGASENTDPPRPRRSERARKGDGANASDRRLALDETVTKATAEPSDMLRPRRDTGVRSGRPRPVPDETLTFTSESTDENRPRRSGF